MVERRKAKRYRTHGRVELPLLFRSVPLEGNVLEVSRDGCSIAVPKGVTFSARDVAEEELWMELQFRTSYLSFRAVAAVRRVLPSGDERRGVVLGLEFVELHARARGDIAELIRDQEEMLVAA